MIAKDQDSGGEDAKFVRLPGFPFEAQGLLGELRNRLEMENGRAMGFEELGEIMGNPKSTAHYWFSAYRHPHLIGFMALLEQLSPEARNRFMDAHCRVFPTTSHPMLVGATEQLNSLLGNNTGISVITGSSERNRLLVLTALGHSFRRRSKSRVSVTGIDVHRPTHFVPVPGIRYINDKLTLNQIRKVVLSVWPKLLTTTAQLVLLNGIWSAVPKVWDDLVRIAALKHVVLAEEPDLASSIQERMKHLETRILRVSSSGQGRKSIRINCDAG
jgi:hypothetical protein